MLSSWQRERNEVRGVVVFKAECYCSGFSGRGWLLLARSDKSWQVLGLLIGCVCDFMVCTDVQHHFNSVDSMIQT